MPVVNGLDLTPIIAAVAGFIALQGPAVAAFLQARANQRKLKEVHQQTNGSLSALVAEITEMRKVIQRKQQELDDLHAKYPQG